MDSCPNKLSRRERRRACRTRRAIESGFVDLSVRSFPEHGARAGDNPVSSFSCSRAFGAGTPQMLKLATCLKGEVPVAAKMRLLLGVSFSTSAATRCSTETPKALRGKPGADERSVRLGRHQASYRLLLGNASLPPPASRNGHRRTPVPSATRLLGRHFHVPPWSRRNAWWRCRYGRCLGVSTPGEADDTLRA